MKQGAGAGRSLEAGGRDGVDPRGVVVGKTWKSLMWEGLREAKRVVTKAEPR